MVQEWIELWRNHQAVLCVVFHGRWTETPKSVNEQSRDQLWGCGVWLVMGSQVEPKRRLSMLLQGEWQGPCSVSLAGCMIPWSTMRSWISHYTKNLHWYFVCWRCLLQTEISFIRDTAGFSLRRNGGYRKVFSAVTLLPGPRSRGIL